MPSPKGYTTIDGTKVAVEDMRGAVQTKLKIRKGFHNAPIAYKVLQNKQFSPEAEKVIAKFLLAAISPDKARVEMQRLNKLSKYPLMNPFSCRQISLVGNFDVQAFFYRGLEIAVFWKRQLSEVIPDPSDPVPEGVIEDPDDVWARLELSIKSPRQLLSAIQSDLNQVSRLEAECAAKDRIIEANDRTINQLQKQIEAMQATPSRKRKK